MQLKNTETYLRYILYQETKIKPHHNIRQILGKVSLHDREVLESFIIFRGTASKTVGDTACEKTIQSHRIARLIKTVLCAHAHNA